MTDTAGLIRSRGGHRAYATKIANETKKLLQEATSADDSQIKVIESDLEVNEALLADKLEELKVIDKEYADTITDDAAYNDEIVKAGADQRCRAAVIKTFDGANAHLTRRPTERLYPIEVRSTASVTPEEADVSRVESAFTVRVWVERPRRVAAKDGILRRRLVDH